MTAVMSDNQKPCLPYTSSPILGSMQASRRQTLLANAGILASVGQKDDSHLSSETLLNRSQAKSSGIVSHLRVSFSSHQDIEPALRSREQSIEPSLAQQIRALASTSNPSYTRDISVMAQTDQFAAPFLLSQKAARDAAVASLTQSMATPSLVMMSPAFLYQRLPISRTLGGFALAKHAFGRDPRFVGLAPSGHVSPISKSVKRNPIVLFMECDEDSLSEYQCLIRQQIELFEADKEEAASSVQGRNKQIVEGQVGIRCRHCTVVPLRHRQKRCMCFPSKLDRIYKAAQNLSAFHLCEHCKHVPEDARKKILLLRERKSPAGGGKRYWSEGVRCLGVYEDSTGLRFKR